MRFTQKTKDQAVKQTISHSGRDIYDIYQSPSLGKCAAWERFVMECKEIGHGATLPTVIYSTSNTYQAGYLYEIESIGNRAPVIHFLLMTYNGRKYTLEEFIV